MRTLLLMISLTLLGGQALFCQIKLLNPGIPARETIVYAERTGERKGSVTQTLELKQAEGKSWYEVSLLSPDSDTVYRVQAGDLSGFYSEVLERSPDLVVRRVTEIVSSKIVPKADELVLSDANSYLTTIRGFPFGKMNYAKISFAGAAAMSGFTMELTVNGKENLKLGGTNYECWKTQLGLSGFLGNLFPKSSVWFNARAPHYVVKFEGARGGMGSPVTLWEIQSYKAD